MQGLIFCGDCSVQLFCEQSQRMASVWDCIQTNLLPSTLPASLDFLFVKWLNLIMDSCLNWWCSYELLHFKWINLPGRFILWVFLLLGIYSNWGQAYHYSHNARADTCMPSPLCKLCSQGVPFLPLLKTLLLEIQTLPRIKARIAPISLCRQQSIKVWYLYPCEIVCDRIREKGSILQNRIINLQLLVPGQRTCNYPQNGMWISS